MKQFLLFLPILFVTTARTQTTQEWLNQKQTKLKYIEEQIAAFQIYAGYLKQGYDIMQDGWSLVDDIKHQDFDIHNEYFTSLKEVKTPVADYPKVDSITSLQDQILVVNEALAKFIEDNENLQQEEKDYINKVMSNLLEKCDESLGQLNTLTTANGFEMSDDDRLENIDGLYADMQDKYSFAKYFENRVETLALSRARNGNDIKTSQLLYGIK